MAAIIGGLIGGAAAGFGARHLFDDTFDSDEDVCVCTDEKKKAQNEGMQIVVDNILGGMGCYFLTSEDQCKKVSQFCDFDAETSTCKEKQRLDAVEAMVNTSNETFCNTFDVKDCPNIVRKEGVMNLEGPCLLIDDKCQMVPLS